MTGRTHDLAAVTALGLVTAVWQPSSLTFSTAVAALIANQIGGITPDIDQPTAPLWRNLPVMRLFGRFAGRLMGGHRFLTHSLIGVILFGFGAKALLSFMAPVLGPHINRDIVWWAFMIGLLSHLIMDMFTKEGVPWLLPLPVNFGLPPLKALRVTTGKWMEMAVIFPGLVIINIAVCWLYYGPIVHFIHERLRT